MATPIPANRAPFDVETALRVTSGTLVREGAANGFGITTDSRAVVTGGAFVALVGESHDGHAFADRASSAGAALVIVERGRGVGIAGNAAIIEVSSTRGAWADLARAHLAAWRAHADRTVVGITGTAGKTTTKELCAALFASHAKTRATVGNLNNLIGVPATVFTLDESDVHAVIEMGMSVRGEIAELGSIVAPDAAIITNIGVGHAEGVGGSRADVGREKGAIYESLTKNGIAIVNADDDACVHESARAGSRRVITFGWAGNYGLAARDVNARGQTITFRSPLAAERTITMALPSEGQAIDFLAALAAVEGLVGVALAASAIEAALASVSLTGRLTMVRLKDGTLLIDDSYNANPESMRVALEALSESAGKNRRKVAILGEMKELGAIASMEHEALGDVVADSGVDLAIGCGGLITRTLDRAAARGVSVHRADSTDGARALAESLVKPGDVVLVKGSRSVGTELVVAGLISLRGRSEAEG